MTRHGLIAALLSCVDGHKHRRRNEAVPTELPEDGVGGVGTSSRLSPLHGGLLSIVGMVTDSGLVKQVNLV